MKQKYSIIGMIGTACSSRVEKAVMELDGAVSADVDIQNASMVVDFDDTKLDHSRIIAAVVRAGYSAYLPGSSEEGKYSDLPGIQRQGIKKRLIASLCFLIPLLYISMSNVFIFPVPLNFLNDENALKLALIQLLLTVPVFIINRKYFFHGVRSLIIRTPDMDSLIAVGSAAAVVYGLTNIFLSYRAMGTEDTESMIQYANDLYFAIAALTLTLRVTGEFIETGAVNRSVEAISRLVGFGFETVRVFRDTAEVEIPLSEVVVGDIVIIKTGERVPVDGIIIEGSTFVDQSSLTGESVPTEKNKGDIVMAASLNQAGSITVKAERVGMDTMASQMIKLSDYTFGAKTGDTGIVNKICGVFLFAAIAVSLVIAAVWFTAGGGAYFALSNALSVLVVACPCLIGLAFPLAIATGIDKGEEFGMLFKSAEALESAGKINAVAFDKTGTLTTGEIKVTDIIPLIDSKQFMSLAAAAERRCEHPIASAIVKKGRCLESERMFVSDFRSYGGLGMRAVIDDLVYYAGDAKLMKQKFIELGEYAEVGEKLAEEGKTVIYFAQEKGDRLLGIIAAADTVKASSCLAAAELKKLGSEVCLLTGDNKKAAFYAGSQIGIDRIIFEVMPQDKEALIQGLQAAGKKTMMVGDGYNDASAIARADVGVAFAGGEAIAIKSADVVLIKNDPMDVPRIISLGKAVTKNVKMNLIWVLLFSCIVIPIAAGVLYPLFGLKLEPTMIIAATMLSFVFTALNSLWLRKCTPV